MNKKTKLLVIFVFLTLMLLTLTQFFDFTALLKVKQQNLPRQSAVIISGMSPVSGKVGDLVYITGATSMANVNYTVWFDIDGNGSPFNDGECIKTGVSNADCTLNTTFTVPPTRGSEAGITHKVALRDETAALSALSDFTVFTSSSIY
jgi:hypothetical protein